LHALQLALSTVDVQSVPHEPQWFAVVFRLVSQPSSALGAIGWVQLPFGELHDELQVPPLHDSVATPAAEQGREHDPQCAGSLPRLVSQPSSAAGAAGWVQLPCGAVQVELQTPAAQLRTLTPDTLHGRVHDPQ